MLARRVLLETTETPARARRYQLPRRPTAQATASPIRNNRTSVWSRLARAFAKQPVVQPLRAVGRIVQEEECARDRPSRRACGLRTSRAERRRRRRRRVRRAIRASACSSRSNPIHRSSRARRLPFSAQLAAWASLHIGSNPQRLAGKTRDPTGEGCCSPSPCCCSPPPQRCCCGGRTLLSRAGTPRSHARELSVSAAGVLTGFFGVGGGFLIVPSLVPLLGVPLTLAVGS